MQKQQLCLRAINMKMKGSVHKQKTVTDPKIGKRFVFLVLICYVVHSAHEHHHIKKTPLSSFFTNCLDEVCSNVSYFSKPVTLCFSDLFNEIETYDKSNDLVALKSL